MNTTTGVMHNLPVLWLVVGLLSSCHAPVPIVGQLNVALLLFMQCNAPCLYQIREAGSNGSWCGRVQVSCSALGWRLAIKVGVASHGTKTATDKKVLASVSLFLTTPFKCSTSNSNGLRKKKMMEVTRAQPWTKISQGFGSAFVQ